MGETLTTYLHIVFIWLMVHTRAVSGLDLTLLIVNGLICTAIAALLAFPDTTPGEHTRWPVRVLRLALAWVYGLIALRVWTGHYLTPVEWSELAANAVMLLQAWLVRGDVQFLVDVYNEISRRRAFARGDQP